MKQLQGEQSGAGEEERCSNCGYLISDDVCCADCMDRKHPPQSSHPVQSVKHGQAKEAAGEYVDSKFPVIAREDYYKTDYKLAYSAYRSEIVDKQEIAENAFIAGYLAASPVPYTGEKTIFQVLADKYSIKQT